MKAEWIPVTERLPEPNTKVLVTVIDHRRRKVNANWNGKKRYTVRIDKIVDYEGDMSNPFWAKGDTPSVTAWMPIPEPYEGEIRRK